jgi:hypothetical protein
MRPAIAPGVAGVGAAAIAATAISVPTSTPPR